MRTRWLLLAVGPALACAEPRILDVSEKPDIEDLCRAICDRMDACGAPIADCFPDCVDEVGGVDSPCAAGLAAVHDCYLDARCGDVLTMCPEDVSAVQHCVLDEFCVVGTASNAVGGSCSVTRSCPGIEFKMKCDDTRCACLQDGTEVRACDGGMTCTVDDLRACCGW